MAGRVHLYCEMRMYKMVFIGAIATGLAFGWSADSENVTLNNGVQISIHTSLGKPTGTTGVSVEMVRAAGDSFYRIFRDQNHLAVFAYELQVARSGTAGFRLTTKPVEDEFARRFPGSDGGKPVPTFSAEKDYTLNNGEPATIAVYELEGQGLAVVDTVEMGLHLNSSGSGGGLRLSGLSLTDNGVPVKTIPGSTVSGRYVMFYIPGKGGFFFSSDPVSGRQFMKAGYIEGNKMQFTLDNLSYECSSLLPIAATPSQEVWVYHDPDYRPGGNWTLQDPDVGANEAQAEFFAAAADSLDWWMAKSPEPAK